MGNYCHLTLDKEITVNELLDALQKINRDWFMCSLKIEVNSEEEHDHIFWLHNEDFNWDFQIWLSKECGTKVTYHPNVQPIDVMVIEEFIAMKLRERLGGGKITYDC